MNNNSLFKVRGGCMLPSFYTILLLFCVTIVSAQNVPIKGTISDAHGVLPGVNIQIKNSPSTIVTDANGNFEIQASPEDTLVVSSMGYLSFEQQLGSRTIFTITLVEDATALDEVTINAGYYNVKDKERTGSISSIKAADIELQPVSNPLAAMQGRMAGVNITQASGVAGGGFSIQIRGINSLRAEGNEPLYIVDGVPYASQSLGNNDVSFNSFAGISSPLSTINPANIENIEVLKDADATAIYGSRGANGVVLITTKKGKAGKTKFDIQSYSTLGKISRRIDLLNTAQYLAMRREAFANDGITDFPEDAYDVNGTWNQTRQTDWQDKLIGGTSRIQNAQISISGGSSKTQFLLSGTYRNETTVFPGNSFLKRAAVAANINHRSENDKFAVVFSANYSSDKNTLPGTDLTRLAYTLAPNAPELYTENGDLNWENGTFENPLSFLEGAYTNNSNTLLANAALSYKLPAGFEIKTSLGFSESQLSEQRSLPNTMYNPSFDLGSEFSEVIINEGERRSWILEPQINWQKKWTNYKLTILTGATLQGQMQDELAIDAYGFASNALMQSLSAATTLTILNDTESAYKYNALFGRINLIAKDKYILNLTARRDGSSRFGTGNRFSNFGAIGAAWIFSKEKFLENTNSILSFGKLRASYGITGNDQIGDYQYLDTYQLSSNIYDGIVGVQPARLFNPNFGWESNKKFETALELGFFKDQIMLSAAYFQNQSSNQLVGIPLPGTTGFPSLQSNLGATVQNSGLELEMHSTNLKSKKIKWSTSLNLTIPRNKLIKFPNLETSTYKNQYIVGQSIFIRKLYHFTGINSETGLYTVEDMNNDGEITAASDLNSFVDYAPKFYGGISNQFKYKNWNFDFLFQFVKQKGSNLSSQFPVAGASSNQPVQVMNHYPDNGASATTQLFTTAANSSALAAYDNYTLSDAMVQDASFIRLKNISLSYLLPIPESIGLSSKIYVQSQNLLTFTKYNGADPENQSAYYLPSLRQFTLGVQVTF